MLTEEETIETASAWEWKVPLGLLIFGLAILVIHGLATAGAKGGAIVLLAVALVMLIYLPITIAAMFIAAPLLDVTFGELGPAIAKIAGIYVFTYAIQDVATTMSHPVLGWIIGLGASLALFSNAFELTLGEAIKAVLVIGLVRGLLALAIASMLPQPAGDEPSAPQPAARAVARTHDLSAHGPAGRIADSTSVRGERNDRAGLSQGERSRAFEQRLDRSAELRPELDLTGNRALGDLRG